ncbi:papain-like cysteine protease family protein [Anaerosacchariphilus polymeriproducens]|uniref:Peptidase C39-like domain-containing protein n=1 Tax=Anaerosacchariphilus polymeriproducens TaxID=1812858 RepID=A0A371AZ29_9FIRM|nr:papain-like cysteine protease family protein [Anaerosacchariphilus polymeriproducens]RDU24803.1 hypothetical protein DWV06_02165 [Anaerosacchariphilus polymeriproducens]
MKKDILIKIVLSMLVCSLITPLTANAAEINKTDYQENRNVIIDSNSENSKVICNECNGLKNPAIDNLKSIPGKWIQASDGRWWYKHNDGTYTTNGWEYIDGKWYYFNAEGWMKTGWVKVKNEWYYLESNGAMRLTDLFQNGSTYTFSTSGSLNSTILGVERQRQEKDNWCWAASAVMVGRYDLPAEKQTVNQTKVVLEVKGEVVNEGGSGEEEARGINISSRNTKNATAINSALSFNDILNTIDNRHPFIVRMKWNSGGGHAIVCGGYRISDNNIWITDPWDQTASQYYSYSGMTQGMTIATGTGRYTGSVTY